MNKNLTTLLCLSICVLSKFGYAQDESPKALLNEQPLIKVSQNSTDDFLYSSCIADIKKSAQNIEYFQQTLCYSYMEGAADGYVYGLKRIFSSLDKKHQKLLLGKLINDDGICQTEAKIQSPRDVAIILSNRDGNDPNNNPRNKEKSVLKLAMNKIVLKKNCPSSLGVALVEADNNLEIETPFNSFIKNDCSLVIKNQDLFSVSSCNLYIKGFFEMEQLATMSAISRFDSQAQLNILSNTRSPRKKSCFPEDGKKETFYAWAKLYSNLKTTEIQSQGFSAFVTNVRACD